MVVLNHLSVKLDSKTSWLQITWERDDKVKKLKLVLSMTKRSKCESVLFPFTFVSQLMRHVDRLDIRLLIRKTFQRKLGEVGEFQLCQYPWSCFVLLSNTICPQELGQVNYETKKGFVKEFLDPKIKMT